MKRVFGLKAATIIEIISALFILLFLYTALNKTFRIDSTVIVLKKTSTLSSIAEELAWCIVVAEYIAVAFLLVPRTRKAGLYVCVALMTAFTGYIGYMMAFYTHLPCSCGGVISKMTWEQHLFFNITFLLLALIGVLLQPKKISGRPDVAEPPPIIFT